MSLVLMKDKDKRVPLENSHETINGHVNNRHRHEKEMSMTPKDEDNRDNDKESVHPLQNKWKFWYYGNRGGLSWEENLRVVMPVCEVERFWAVYNSIKSPSEIRNGCSYFFFKDGLKPMWEDEGNRRGGRWLINCDRRSSTATLDEKWLEVLLCLIGEAFDEDGEDICGAVVDIKGKFDRISVWTKCSENKDRILKIGHILKARLQLGQNASMIYEKHLDPQNKSGSLSRSSSSQKFVL